MARGLGMSSPSSRQLGGAARFLVLREHRRVECNAGVGMMQKVQKTNEGLINVVRRRMHDLTKHLHNIPDRSHRVPGALVDDNLNRGVTAPAQVARSVQRHANWGHDRIHRLRRLNSAPANSFVPGVTGK